MQYVLRHGSTEGRFCPEDWVETPDNNLGSYWAEVAGQSLADWKQSARAGSRYYVATSVYLEAVDN